MENSWILVEWLEKDNIFPIFNIVNENRVVGKRNVTVGNVIELRKKHCSTLKKAQVLKVSDNKNSLKEVKSMLTRLNQQMRHTVETCMNTIGTLKTEIMDIYDSEDIEITENLNKKKAKKNKFKKETSTRDQETQTDCKYFTDKIKTLQDSLDDGYKKLMRAVTLLNNNSMAMRKRNAAKRLSLAERRNKKNIKVNNENNFEPPRKISRVMNDEENNKETHFEQNYKETDELNVCQRRTSKATCGELDKTANKINEMSEIPSKETQEQMNCSSTTTKLICNGKSVTARSKDIMKSNINKKIVKERKIKTLKTPKRKSTESTQSSSSEKQLRKRTKKIESYTETDEEEFEKSDTVSRYAQNFSPPLLRHYVNTRKILAPINDNVKLESFNNYPTQDLHSGAAMEVETYNHGDQTDKCDVEKSSYNIIILDADGVELGKVDANHQETMETNPLLNNSNDTEGTPSRGCDKTRQHRILKNNNSINYCDSSEASTPYTNNKNSQDLVPIGKGNALVPKHVLDKLDWKSYTTATRKLLQAIFSRETLSTHSLSGKASPAFSNKPAKKQLDPKVIDDIVTTVAKECDTKECFIRTCITVKCADEAKMLKQRLSRRKAGNDENVNEINSTV